MSLATLKRKTEARYFPHSVEGVGFSLNGSTRFFGVGSILGRSVTRTPMRGEVPMGHGGGTKCRVRGIYGRRAHCDNNNEYPFHIIRSGELTPQTSVKLSTKTAEPYMELNRMKTLYSNGCHWVKPNTLDQSDLLRNSEAKTQPAVCRPLTAEEEQFLTESGGKPCPVKPIGYTKAAPGPLPYSMFYMQKDWKTRSCALPSWPPRLNNSSCGTRKWPPVQTSLCDELVQ